ncbi:MAG: DMT family transporter [Pseudohongiellaceae bacterium]|jgi:drug/metabolite transporter (DMT)-like permease
MTQRPLYGLVLSLVTALMWGTLPVAFTLLRGGPDPLAVTFVRFLFSSVLVAALLWRGRQLPVLTHWGWQDWLALLLATLFLTSNFVLYLLGLDHISPEATAVIIQLAPFILMFGSVWMFGERFTALDWLGAALLFIGLLLFFNERLPLIVRSLGGETLGIVYILLAALTWGLYGLLQKRLLRSVGSVQLTLLIYGGGALLLLLVADSSSLLTMNAPQVFAVAFGCLNMVIGYGAFTEALRVWQGAKVSAVIALAPVITIITMQAAVALWPSLFVASGLNRWAYAGAALVVAGSMLSALGKQR